MTEKLSEKRDNISYRSLTFNSKILANDSGLMAAIFRGWLEKNEVGVAFEKDRTAISRSLSTSAHSFRCIDY